MPGNPLVVEDRNGNKISIPRSAIVAEVVGTHGDRKVDTVYRWPNGTFWKETIYVTANGRICGSAF